ncbi:hypothetical protein [Aeromicrobium piscarium]|uniref:Cholesterol esterase n=1 Tax=Aeromicrobium piscarium TaxID=2590901 RepID=A0A554RX74_9ACTN|nr:hypothetical protein [Aeromicrobium piscarium]TSD58684.1 hypothetical protein FNM00_13575 [Aeromicrobium piscarium]
MKLRRIRNLVVAGAVGPLAWGLMGPAHAHHTQVTVGGSATPAGAVPITGTNTTNIAVITDRGLEFECLTASMSGEIVRGASIGVGGVIGSIDSLGLSDCVWAGIFDISASLSDADVTLVEHPAAAGDDLVVDIEVPAMRFVGTGCSFTVTGTLRALIKEDANSDAILELVPVDWNTMDGFSLDVVIGGSGSSCLGAVVNGDAMGANWLDEFTNPHESQFALGTNGAGAISHG